ncbi:MAG: hypothetical protein ACI38Q_01250 [Candidatus Bruticola sp.]
MPANLGHKVQIFSADSAAELLNNRTTVGKNSEPVRFNSFN